MELSKILSRRFTRIISGLWIAVLADIGIFFWHVLLQLPELYVPEEDDAIQNK